VFPLYYSPPALPSYCNNTNPCRVKCSSKENAVVIPSERMSAKLVQSIKDTFIVVSVYSAWTGISSHVLKTTSHCFGANRFPRYQPVRKRTRVNIEITATNPIFFLNNIFIHYRIRNDETASVRIFPAPITAKYRWLV